MDLERSDGSQVVAEPGYGPRGEWPLCVPDHNVTALAALPRHRQHAAATAQVGHVHATLGQALSYSQTSESVELLTPSWECYSFFLLSFHFMPEAVRSAAAGN